jgi:Calcineurin-like phosphoesterase
VNKGSTVNKIVRTSALLAGVAMVTGAGLIALASAPGQAAAIKPVGRGITPGHDKCADTSVARSSRAWSFGIEADTQWTVNDDGRNPFTCSVDIARQLDDQFIQQNAKFVVEVGDLVDSGTAANEAGRAAFAQDLYNAGIGFYPLSGNHDDGQGAALVADYPQTQTALMNTTPSSAFGLTPDSLEPFASVLGDPFQVGTISTKPAAPKGFTGLDYALDYRNARLVFMDQFTSPDSTVPAHEALTADDVNWMNGQLTGRPAGTQAFVFGHKGIITQNHTDDLFGADPTAQPDLQDQFISDLQKAGVHYYIGGHDHMYNRAVDASPDGKSSVQDLVCQSDASKFYVPYGEAGYTARSVDATGAVKSSGTLAKADPTQTNDNIYDVQVAKAKKLAGFTGTTRETPIAQDLNKVGYYIVTVDGANVTVDYYAAVVNPTLGSGEYLLSSTPYLNFVKEESFGYSLNGKEFFVPQGGSYTQVHDSFDGTTAQILGGTDQSTATDVAGRKPTRDVTTGWSTDGAHADLASNVFTLWGMSDVGAQTSDNYALSLSYGGGGHGPVLVTKDAEHRWVNAVDTNIGGTATFVSGPYKSSYGLGTYGVDQATHTAWAVVNHTGSFAVQHVLGYQH